MRIFIVGLIAVAALASGCATKSEVELIRKDIAAIRSQMVGLEKKAEAVPALQKELSSAKTYFKKIADDMARMRNDVVRMLDEQNLRIDGTQQTQIRLLQHQKTILYQALAEIDKAMRELQASSANAGTAPTKATPRPDGD
jgi:predicted  nucleic acid-binding Zn-ribbon protein